MIFIQREEADRKVITELVQTTPSGCVAQFVGVVRDNSEGKEVSNMTIEVYEEMARKQLEAIRAECIEEMRSEREIELYKKLRLKLSKKIEDDLYSKLPGQIEEELR